MRNFLRILLRFPIHPVAKLLLELKMKPILFMVLGNRIHLSCQTVWGTGIPRLYNRCAEYGLSEPLFEEFGDGIKVTMFRKVSNTQEKVSNATKNMCNTLKEVSNAAEKVINNAQKVSNTFEKYMPLFREAEITDKFIKNIEQVFCACGTGVPFGQANVQEWLSCSKSKATNVMNAMKAAKVIKKVTGYGSGRYEFIEL